MALSGPMVQRVKRQAATHYVLPDGAELIVGSISSTFSCEGHIYGYYADVANKCQIFHICAPSENGRKTQIFSFFCGNQTVFDQERLVCAAPGSATPCEQAPTKIHVNENFGVKTLKSPEIKLRWGASFMSCFEEMEPQLT
uniref:Chitin-binding type-2 domain-containing protein n=1 Tax=Strigamia maritima TaxID=126957 RepID=T1J9Q3_STRMM